MVEAFACSALSRKTVISLFWMVCKVLKTKAGRDPARIFENGFAGIKLVLKFSRGVRRKRPSLKDPCS
jgi:hypothetical protein